MLLEFIGRPHLAESRLFNGERDDGLLDFSIDAVLDKMLTTVLFRPLVGG
jgi:hypothetical protein